MSHKHRRELRKAATYQRAVRATRRMTLGQVLTHHEVLFAPLKGMKFAAIIQPLYTSDMFR